ncbi:MAG: HEAT repeat domain-containing protein [Nitrospiraceae bacterium]
MDVGWTGPSAFGSMAHLGWVVTITIHAFILLLVVWILVLRVLRRHTERRRRNMVDVWRPLLAESLVEVPAMLPSIHPRDHVLFLYLWNYLQESIKGDASGQLNDVARRVGMDTVAMRLLHTGRLRLQLLAVATLGHLKEASVWDKLVRLAHAHNAFLAIEAARAMVRIRPKAAIPLLIPLISTRSDWSPLKVMALLNEAGADLVATALAQATVSAPPRIAARLIRLLASLRSPYALPIIRQLMSERKLAEDVIAASLSFFGECSDPQDLPMVRVHLTHPTWYIRVQAATALGKIGLEEDEARLIGLLGDTYWWVRYRAAEALSNLPSMTEAKMAEVQATLPTIESQEVITPFLTKFRGTKTATALPAA